MDELNATDHGDVAIGLPAALPPEVTDVKISSKYYCFCFMDRSVNSQQYAWTD